MISVMLRAETSFSAEQGKFITALTAIISKDGKGADILGVDIFSGEHGELEKDEAVAVLQTLATSIANYDK